MHVNNPVKPFDGGIPLGLFTRKDAVLPTAPEDYVTGALSPAQLVMRTLAENGASDDDIMSMVGESPNGRELNPYYLYLSGIEGQLAATCEKAARSGNSSVPTIQKVVKAANSGQAVSWTNYVGAMLLDFGQQGPETIESFYGNMLRVMNESASSKIINWRTDRL